MINTYQYFSERFKCTVEISYKNEIIFKVTINDPELQNVTLQNEALSKFPMFEPYFIQSMADNKTLVKIQEDVTFDIFYNLYAYKVGSKSKAKRAWDNLSKKDQLSAYHYIAAYKQHKKTSGEFLQHASSYLNGKVWE